MAWSWQTVIATNRYVALYSFRRLAQEPEEGYTTDFGSEIFMEGGVASLPRWDGFALFFLVGYYLLAAFLSVCRAIGSRQIFDLFGIFRHQFPL